VEINSDELGEKGESRFREICADARLICNKSERDRSGWDFIVEFRFDDEENLDARPLPISAHFQIKTVRASTNIVALRLSSAERLAKDPKPSFIYVFTVNPDLSLSSSYILHLADEPLGRILKRLREERARPDRTPVNQQKITFGLSSMQALTPTGAALRNALIAMCADVPGYIAKKRQQLEQLGYSGSPVTVKTTLQVSSMEELADGLLGLKPIPVVRFMPSETRFGITMPLKDQEAFSGTLQVSPVPIDYCTITARETPITPPVTFRAAMFTTSKLLPRDSAKMLIQHKLFDFHSTATSQRFAFSGERAHAASCTVQEWVDLLRFQVMLFTETGTLSINPDRAKSIRMPIKFQEKIDPKPSKAGLELFLMAKEIFEIAGIVDRKVAFADIASSHSLIRIVSSFVRGKELAGVLRFGSEKPDAGLIPTTAPALYLNQIIIAGVVFGLCANVEISALEEGQAIEWKSSVASIICIQPLENGDTYEHFCERMKTDHPASLVMVGTIDSGEMDRTNQAT
jgi:hypothetical protein